MAKRFKFSAEPVLQLRRHAEREALQRLGEAQRRVSGIEDAIRAVRRDMAEEDRRVREGMLTGTVDVNYIALYRRRLMALNRELMDLAVQLREAAIEVARRRATAGSAIRGRKVMDTLKDRRLREHLREADLAEQKQADELYLGRRNAGGDEQPGSTPAKTPGDAPPPRRAEAQDETRDGDGDDNNVIRDFDGFRKKGGAA